MAIYALWARDAGFDVLGVQDINRCPACGHASQKFSESYVPRPIPKRALRYDIVESYDGFIFFSNRALEVLSSKNLSGLSTVSYGVSFHMMLQTQRRVRLDLGRMNVSFARLCETCGRYMEVSGALPIYLDDGEHVGPSEFVMTDIEFGAGDEKRPLLLIGQQVRDVLQRSKLKGGAFRQVST